MALNEAQRKQVELQIREHHHTRYEVDIQLSNQESLKGFAVHRNVMRPEKMASLFLAKWLLKNKRLFKGKTTVDMGCGAGIQGIVMAKHGAKKVIFSDISTEAVSNTKENVEKFGLRKESQIIQGNLFEKIKDKADIIVFNHPFFADEPIKDEPVSMTMLNRGDLISRFLEDSRKFLTKKGIIIMPFFHLAGEKNNPAIQGPKYGYRVIEKFRETIQHESTLQKGEISIYQLQPE